MSHSQHAYLFRILLTTALSLLAVAPLLAGDSSWYLNAKLGQGSLETQFGKDIPNHFEGDDDTGSVEVGFVLRPHLAIQVGYHDLGDYEGYWNPCPPDVFCLTVDPFAPDLLVTAEVSGVSLALVPRLPLLDDRLMVYGKLGVIDWDSDLSGAYGFREGFSGTDLLAGVGVRYGFRNGFGVLAEYERFDFDHESASLGASWRF